MRVVGLMSGTSLDGIDAALVEIGDAASSPAGGARAVTGTSDGAIRWRVTAFESVPYTDAERAAISGAIHDGAPADLARLHAALGEWLAEAVLSVCRAADIDLSDVDLIGSHGQTVWHQPPGGDPAAYAAAAGPGGRGPASPIVARGHTLQLGDAATIAERTGVPVVSDFRSRDMAAGGEGAPLVPWVDRLLFADDHVRVLQNIGGMANATRVPARGSAEPVVAFDTGPGNAVIDAAIELATDGALRYDANGEWALRGRVDEALAGELLADPYFMRAPPKSTGRERFGRPYVERLVRERRPSDRAEWAALVATLTAVVARSIGGAVARWAPPGRDGEVVVTGGGAENPVLMDWVRAELEPVPVRHGRVLGIDPAAKEAIAFAVLAWAHAVGRPTSLPEVTGAVGPRVLGSYTPGR